MSLVLLLLAALNFDSFDSTSCELVQENALYYIQHNGTKAELPASTAHPELRSCKLSQSKEFLVVEVLQGLQGTQSLRGSIDVVIYRNKNGSWVEDKLVTVGRAERTKEGIQINLDDYQLFVRADHVVVESKH